ncbi:MULTISPECIES: winged helix DNA-binding domain-containing protein [unclassified Knoellia]|uniref:winged helix DNA-binding domain-containing protein n=1 Tax=Knoellia altitudinis TaxID=3404795 RepID=UPI00361FA628
MRVLSGRELNRALLARNLLLERSTLDVVAATEHLVGLQAQEPQEPYVGLFSRLADFDPVAASDLLESRRVVRTLMMRRTIHLLSAADCLGLRALHQPMLEQRMRGVLRTRLVGVDEEELREAGTPLFVGEARQLAEAGRALADRWPGAVARDLGDALSSLVPLVQVPPRGLWRQAGPARNTTISTWLGQDVPTTGGSGAIAAESLVLRYLRAYGPAASADVRSWSGLAGLPAAVKNLLPDLVTYRDERGRLLLDVPDGLLPDPDTPAPPRFLPAFDNAVLGYDDRSRIIDDADKGLSILGARYLLVDGRVRATWTTRVDDDATTVLVISPLGGLTRAEAGDDVDAEAEWLLTFLTSGGGHRIEWAAA